MLGFKINFLPIKIIIIIIWIIFRNPSLLTVESAGKLEFSSEWEFKSWPLKSFSWNLSNNWLTVWNKIFEHDNFFFSFSKALKEFYIIFNAISLTISDEKSISL